MSCMMTGANELATLATYICDILECSEMTGTIEGVKRIRPPEALREALREKCLNNGWRLGEIFRSLYRMNERAYNGRYELDDESAAPECPSVSVDTSEENRREWMPRLHHLLTFYTYQCMEDATYKDPLYLALDQLRDNIAHVIVHQIAHDLGCKWGQF